MYTKDAIRYSLNLANEATMRALATIEDKTPLKDMADKVCQPVKWKGRQVRALQPLHPDDAPFVKDREPPVFELDKNCNQQK